MVNTKNLRRLFDNNLSLITVVSLFIVSFIPRIIYISHYLDEWDSINFALGVKDFNIMAHQPHPPGYPSYIFIARCFDLFLNNVTATLNLMSVIFGSLLIIFIFLLARELFGYKVGLVSAAIAAFIPAMFVFSEVAMSDIVFACFFTACIYLLIKGLKDDRYLFFGAFLTGFTIGIRPPDCVIILIICLLVFYWKKSIAKGAYSLVFLGMGILTWLIPVSISCGSLTKYIDLTRSMFGTYAGYGFSAIQFNNLGHLLQDGWETTYLALTIILFFAIVLAIFDYRRALFKKELVVERLNNKGLIILVIWLFVSAINSMAFLYLYTARYILPTFVALAIAFGLGAVYIWDRLDRKMLRAIYALILIALIVSTALGTISIASKLSGIAPAPVQAAYYVKNNYSPGDTAVLASCYRHFQYYLPDYDVIYIDYLNYTSLAGSNKTRIVSDLPLAIDRPSKIKEFNRDVRVEVLYTNTVLYECELYNDPLLVKGFAGISPSPDKPVMNLSNGAEILYISDSNTTSSVSFDLRSLDGTRNAQIDLNGRTVKVQTIPATPVEINLSLELKEGANVIQINSSNVNGLDNSMPIFELSNATMI